MHKACAQTPMGGGVTGTASMPTIPALRKLRLEDLEVEFKDSYMKSGVKQPTTTKIS